MAGQVSNSRNKFHPTWIATLSEPLYMDLSPVTVASMGLALVIDRAKVANEIPNRNPMSTILSA